MKRKIRLTESDLHRVIKESVKRILSKKKDRLSSSKLEQLIKQHGGIISDERWNFIIPCIKDEDVIGVYPRNYIDMEEYSRELKYHEQILELPLKDGKSLYFIYDHHKGSCGRDLPKSFFGDKPKPSNKYNWQNPKAEELFHSKGDINHLDMGITRDQYDTMRNNRRNR